MAGPNTPYVVTILVAGTALAWFLLTQDVLDGGSGAAGAVAPTAAEAPSGTAQTDAAEAVVPEAAETSSTTTASLPPLQGLAVEPLLDGLVQPVFATTAPGDNRIYIAERRGTIQIFDPATGVLNPEPFLDVRTKTRASIGIELGLLGLAFHPRYSDNGRFFVYYTDLDNDTAVAEYARIDSDRADPSSERIFVAVERQGLRHNAGMLQFGPEGHLYIAIGDGGLFEVYGQDPGQFLGTILRLDVDGAEPYAVPSDNPFVAGDGAAEVWAYGLRNPWRFAIDAPSGTMYIGDVGQADAEEINAVPLESAGYNFGWPVMEGSNCWLPRTGCDRSGKVLPVTEYTHADGCSVTGGYVYRGRRIPELEGHYFYSDWCSGWIRSLELVDGIAANSVDWSQDLGPAGQVTSFGLDGDGELLFVTFEGVLGRIVPVR